MNVALPLSDCAPGWLGPAVGESIFGYAEPV